MSVIKSTVQCEDCPCTQEFWKCKAAQTDRDSITGHTWTQPSKDCPYVQLASARKEIEELKAKLTEYAVCYKCCETCANLDRHFCILKMEPRAHSEHCDNWKEKGGD
jgi:hypothetical protein